MNIQWKAQYNAYVSAVLHYKTIIIVYKLPWLLCIVLLWLYSSWTFCFRYFHVAILKTVNLFNYANFCNGMSTLDISLNANCRQHKYRIVLFRESYIETLIHLSKSNKFPVYFPVHQKIKLKNSSYKFADFCETVFCL